MRYFVWYNLHVVILVILFSSSAYGETREFTRESDQKKLTATVITHDGKKVTLQLENNKKFTLDPTIFVEADQQYLSDWLSRSRGNIPAGDLDPRIKPGATFRVEMPELAKTFTGKPAGFTISIPMNFNYPDPLPLLVFLNGGSGDDGLGAAENIADASRYLLVSLPYTSEIKKDGPLGHIKSNMELIEAYHAAMLERLVILVPNISKTHRVIGGSSNGAHIVGSAIAMDWDCYLKFFRGFIVWEGGGSLSRDFSAAKGKDYCNWVGWGAKSTSKEFAMGVAEAMDDSRMRVTKEEIASAGHGMNGDAQAAMRKWLVEVAEPAFEEMAADAK